MAPSDINFGTIMMYIAANEDSPMETRAFRGMDSALDWLGLTQEP